MSPDGQYLRPLSLMQFNFSMHMVPEVSDAAAESTSPRETVGVQGP